MCFNPSWEPTADPTFLSGALLQEVPKCFNPSWRVGRRVTDSRVFRRGRRVWLHLEEKKRNGTKTKVAFLVTEATLSVAMVAFFATRGDQWSRY